MRLWRRFTGMAVVAGALLAAWLFTRDDESQTRPDTAERAVLIPSGAAEAAVRMVINDAALTVTLRRDQDRWLAGPEGHARADAAAVARILDALRRVPPGKLISRNPAAFEEFKLTPALARRLRVFDAAGNLVVDLYAGKRPDLDVRSTYARRPGEDEAWLIETPLAAALDRPEGWRDKIMFEAVPEDLVRIAIEATTYSIVLMPEAAGTRPAGAGDDLLALGLARPWRVVRPVSARADAGAMARLSARVRRFIASGFEDNPAGLSRSWFGLAPALVTVIFERNDKPPLALRLGKRLDNIYEGFYYAAVDGDDQIYIVAESLVDLFLIGPRAFADPQNL